MTRSAEFSPVAFFILRSDLQRLDTNHTKTDESNRASSRGIVAEHDLIRAWFDSSALV
jgi:hypothetical protein